MEKCTEEVCEAEAERHCYLCAMAFCSDCLPGHYEEFHNRG